MAHTRVLHDSATVHVQRLLSTPARHSHIHASDEAGRWRFSTASVASGGEALRLDGSVSPAPKREENMGGPELLQLISG